jgi:hypothetical protein
MSGLAAILSRLSRASKAYKDATEAAIYQKGLAVNATAAPLVPVDTGRLRASGYVAPPEGGMVEVGYGADYAVPVHERTEIGHKVGQAKFLETAVNEHRSGYEEWIAKKARENYNAGIAPGKVRATAPSRPRRR